MDIALPAQLEAAVQAKLRDGHYRDVSELVGEALRLLLTVDELRAAKLAALRQAVAAGDADLQAGRATVLSSADEIEEFFAEL